jgi:mRNA interferase MazF
MTNAVRSQIYHVDDVGSETGSKHYYVVVSNNRRNRAIDTVLALMITTTDKSHIPTAVQLSHEDPVAGYVVADDIERLYEDELTRLTGSMSTNTMTGIREALKIALSL